MKAEAIRVLALTSLLLVSEASGFAPAPAGPPAAQSLEPLLAAEAVQTIARALPASYAACRASFRVRVEDADVRVRSRGLGHPYSFADGPLRESRAPYSDATYRARLTLRVQICDPSGRVTATKSFTGYAARMLRAPPPHPYQTFVSIHGLARRDEACSFWPSEADLLRHALHDASEDATQWVSGTLARP